MSDDARCGADELIRRLRRVVGSAPKVALHEPRLAGREWDYVKACLDSGWVSSVGEFVNRFETALSGILDGHAVVACVNGTAALRIALLLAGVRRDDEVLVPALTFVATANAVSHLGAIPHFLDSDGATLSLDPAKLESRLSAIAVPGENGPINRQTGRRLAALVPMHCFGHPADMDALNEVAARWRLPVVEDATESLGSRYKGRACGALAPLAAVSFNGNKIVTTGGGGAVVASDPAVAARAKHLTTTAKLPHRWAFLHDEIGYNDRMPNINAALGVAQLEQLPQFVRAKRTLHGRYAEALNGLSGARLFTEQPWAESNYWLNALLLDEPDTARRDRLLEATNDAGLMTRPAWTLMHRLPMYGDHPRDDLSTAEALEARLVNLPSSATLEPALG